MTDRELMQQALYVFDLFYESGFDREDCFAVIKALRERLAQPEQEPVFDCPRCGHCCPQRKPLTKEQAKMIFRMARELEDTGRLTSLSEGAERQAFMQKNRGIQCALEDYLRNLTEAAHVIKGGA